MTMMNIELMIGRHAALFAASTVLLSGLTSRAEAQLRIPPIRQYGTTTASANLPVRASQAVVNLAAERAAGDASVSVTRGDYPDDSLRNVVVVRAQEWLKRLDGAGRSGIQLDPYGRIYVAAGMDGAADAQFTARLASSAVSFAEKAYTREVAVRAFADAAVPSRLAIAERYLAALATMGPAAMPRELDARLVMIRTYYKMDRPADVVRHARVALTLVGAVPFGHRGDMYDPSGVYPLIVDTFMRDSSLGRAAVDSMNAILARSTESPADSAVIPQAQFAGTAAFYRQRLQNAILIHRRVGERGDPLVSNHWINRPGPSEQTIPVNDGKVRVIEVGSHFCGICLVGLAGLQRIQDAFPHVETTFLTFTVGEWANRVISAEEEVVYLDSMYKVTRKIRLPISIWMSKKIVTAEGDTVPDFASMANKGYPEIGKPQFYVLDGTGIIRRVYMGFDHDIEQRIVETVRYLLTEQSQSRSQTGRPSSL